MRNLLILILLVAAVWWVRRAVTRAKERAAVARKDGGGQGGKGGADLERILECAHCGLNVPESDGVREGGRFYCCNAHRLAGPRAD